MLRLILLDVNATTLLENLCLFLVRELPLDLNQVAAVVQAMIEVMMTVTRKHKRFIKDCMGYLGMSRNEAERVYQDKGGIEYACMVCNIRMQKAFMRAAKTMEDFFTALRRQWRNTKHG